MFSIIMPAYNRAHWINKAIESVIAQTFREYELLIVDDGSEDNLHETVRPYLSEKIQYFRIDHAGQGPARNFGLSKARYPWIAYLDTDNQWHPEYLQTMHGALTAEKDRYQAAYCQAAVLNKNPQTQQITRDGILGKPFDFKALLHKNYIDLNGFVHSAKILQYTGTFDTLKRLCDWDMILRITSLFEPLFVPQVLVDYYRMVADNTVTAMQPVDKYLRKIRKQVRKYSEPVTLVHDTVPYTWDQLPTQKYLNWVRMQHSGLNTDSYTAWGYPYLVQIEPTNLCNLSCEVCPVARKILDRPSRNMTFSEFKSIVDDMEDYLMLLVLWDWGEPFMNPELPAMVAYAAERDIRTVTSTNAHFLNRTEYIEQLLKSGLSTLIIALDSLEQVNYTRFRKQGDLSTVLEGLNNLIAAKKRLGANTLIHIRMVVTRHNEHEVGKMKRFAKKIGADWFSVKSVNVNLDPQTRPEDLEPRNRRYRRMEYQPGTWQRIPSEQPCRYIWNIANINTNGDVVGCCYDYNASMKTGNVFEQPLTRIWNGSEFRRFRQQVYEDRMALEKCTHCTVNYKMSARGWFPVVASLKKGPEAYIRNLRKQFKQFRKDLRTYPPFKALRKLRKQLLFRK